MGLRIATNVSSINAQRSLERTTRALDSSFAKLSSGSRITKAADDSAGLAISEKLRAEVRSLNQAKRNTNDGISMIQTAEGGLTEMGNILIRMRELSIQAASDTIGNEERAYVNIETQALKSEIDRIAKSTSYNGTRLLDGSSPALNIQVGSHNEEGLDSISYDGKNLESHSMALGIEEINTTTREMASSNLAKLDVALQRVNGNRANLGALQSRLQSTVNNTGTTVENLEAAKSRITDADVALETAELAKNNILNQSGIAVLAQANASSSGALKLL